MVNARFGFLSGVGENFRSRRDRLFRAAIEIVGHLLFSTRHPISGANCRSFPTGLHERVRILACGQLGLAEISAVNI